MENPTTRTARKAMKIHILKTSSRPSTLKKIHATILALSLSVSCFANNYSSNAFSTEHYKQTLVLKKLDIEPDFISNIVFEEKRAMLSRGQSHNLATSTERAYELIPAIQKIIIDNDLPREFLFLAMVESGLHTQSTSKVRATGIWQFMEKTARNFNLRVDEFVDERKDPFKSTLAATNYLKELKAEFGKWYLAILAYNCGSGRLRQAIRDAGSDDLAILLDERAGYLPKETRYFIKKILSLAFLANSDDFLLDESPALANYALSNEYVRVKVPAQVSLQDLARIAGMQMDELKRVNAHFRYDFTPPKQDYYMYVPLEKSLFFEQNLARQKLAKVEIRLPKTINYVVQKGDTLWSIARKYNISVAQIREFNKLDRKNRIRPKQKLVLPLGDRVFYAKNEYR